MTTTLENGRSNRIGDILTTEPPNIASLVRPRISELGKIKIGGLDEQVRKSAKGGEWRAPKKLDHFIITTLYRDDKGNLAPDTGLMDEIQKDQDGKIRRIPIMLMSNDIDDVVQAAFVFYAGKKLGARSDGKTITWHVSPKDGTALAEPQHGEWTQQWMDWKDSSGNRRFKLHTIFNCVIMAKQSRWGGVFKFRTTSQISASQLVGSLIQIQQLTGGVLRGLPLQLVVRPIQVAPDGKPTKVFVVHVELLGTDIQAIQDKALALARHESENRKAMLMIENEYRRMLVAPGEFEEDDEVASVQQEFHPEGTPATISITEITESQLPAVEPEDVSQEEPAVAPPVEPKPHVLHGVECAAEWAAITKFRANYHEITLVDAANECGYGKLQPEEMSKSQLAAVLCKLREWAVAKKITMK